MATSKPTKRGRPRLPAGKAKLRPMNMRTTDELRGRIEAASAESGLSLSQEVERRLEHSFLDEALTYRDFGGKGTYHLMNALASVKAVIESMNSAQWNRDRKTFEAVMEAWNALLVKVLQLEEAAPQFDAPRLWAAAAEVQREFTATGAATNKKVSQPFQKVGAIGSIEDRRKGQSGK